MIYVVLGFHKSGTTLVARTLHESGINMGVTETGEYPACKYEDPRVLKIKNDILYDGKITPSYELPTSYNCKIEDILKYIEIRKSENNDDWGFKCPDITLCYSMWERCVPFWVTAIGIRRDLKGVLSHYARAKKPPDSKRIEAAYHIYNEILLSYHIPIISYEDLLDCGPVIIERTIGLKNLPDVRRIKK